MKTKKKIYTKIIIFLVAFYAIFTFTNQQITLNEYDNDCKELEVKIEQAKSEKQELDQKKEDVNSLDFIEQLAREKLDMYLPNEKVYVDSGL